MARRESSRGPRSEGWEAFVALLDAVPPGSASELLGLNAEGWAVRDLMARGVLVRRRAVARSASVAEGVLIASAEPYGTRR